MWESFEASLNENERDQPLPLRRALFDVLLGSGMRAGGGVTKKMVSFEFGAGERSSRIDDPKQGVSQADVYQMMAYAQRYLAPRLTLLYPITAASEPKTLHTPAIASPGMPLSSRPR
jgi:hypothetical protein